MIRVFRKIRLRKIDDLAAWSSEETIVYFLVYEHELSIDFETILIERVDPLASEDFVKISLSDTANLFEIYGRPPEFPMIGAWWRTYLGEIHAKAGLFETNVVEQFIKRTREWRGTRI